MSAPSDARADTRAGARILVVEDDADQRLLVASMLRRTGHRVREASSRVEAEAELARGGLDLVLSDWKLGDGDGSELLATVRAERPETAFVMVTAYGTIARAVDAVRAGADDYLAKPFERDALLLAVDRALRSRRLLAENRRLVAELEEARGGRDRLVDLVGGAPSMQRLYRRMEKLADTDATVLLTGESGTGKELAARALHALSRRAERPFRAINCAAIPEGLLESEFFGVVKGAYTGADQTREGVFDAARGGTLFLDEIGEMPLALQPKLLRVLQEGVFTPVGGAGRGGPAERRIDVRVIAATNRDLQAEAAAGRFREDLYYRLAIVPLEMPPLRARREDLPLLIEHFAERSARRHGVDLAPLPAALVRRLLDHGWPGNVRELGNAVERLVLLAEDGVVSVDDLPPEILHPRPTDPVFALPAAGLSWEAHERDLLRQALERARGNRAAAARLLELPYKAFLYRLEKHGLA